MYQVISQATGNQSSRVLGEGIVAIEILALLFNGFCFYLIYRQGFKTFDMWIATIMTSCDVGFVFVKLAAYIYTKVNDRGLYQSETYASLEGTLITFFVSTSVNCVTYLALARLWVIYLKRKLNTTGITIFISSIELLFLLATIMVAVSKGYKLMPSENYFYPDLLSANFANRLLMVLMILENVFAILSVNIVYILLSKYYKSLSYKYIPPPSDYNYHAYSENAKKLRIKAYIKTGLMLVLYNLTMIPHLVIVLMEVFSGELRDVPQDSIVIVSIALLAFVNPFILIATHENTFNELKKVFSFNLFKKSVESEEYSFESSTK